MQKNLFLETRSAGCKINLGLKITGTLSNGYHTIESVFWPLSDPCDTLDFYASNSKGFSVSCDTQDIDLENNTLTKAYAAFVKTGGELQTKYQGLHVNLRKVIPHGAGLGGGSSDAATLLLWLNDNALKPLSHEQMHKVALSVGADVPFFLENIPSYVQGIGEDITPLTQVNQELYNNFLGTHILLICPNIMISTPWAYATWDKKQQEKKINENAKNKLTKSCSSDKYKLACGNKQSESIHNDFEAVVFETWPALSKIKNFLLTEGAENVIMSGSGSTLVSMMPNEAEAKRIAACFESSQAKVFITTL